MNDPIIELCHCGKPLHYTNPVLEDYARKLIAYNGSEFVRVTIGDRAWMVQRHYIALHGINAQEIPTLGFEEVDPTAP